jgi:3-oxoacyl-[acyl-carrier-protein] synthase III
MTRTIFCTVAAALLLTAGNAAAHHSFAAEFDEHKLVTVTGTVTSFQWTNPHTWLYLDGKDETGKAAKWKFEMGSPNGLLSRGWKRSDLKKGDTITIQGFGAKDAENMANATTVTLADGRKLFGGFKTTPGAPAIPTK